MTGSIAASAVRPDVPDRWLPSVLLFMFVFIVSYVDRQILSLVVQPVKTSLGLSDFQIGLLQGLAFSLVLAVATAVTASLVDRGNRVRLLGFAVIAWCTMTILCGFAGSFGVLLLARTGLALSEAIVPVAVLSMICDIAPKASVPRASALFMAAPYIGSGVALLLGGPLLATMAPFEGIRMPLLGAFEPWRGLFFLLGSAGIVIGVLLLFLHEPARRGMTEGGDPAVSVLPFLRENAGFLVPMLVANAMIATVSYTIYAWTPTLMIRVHGMPAAIAGVKVGAIFVGTGVLGCMLGSWAMSLSRDGRALAHVVRTIRVAFLCLGPPLIAFPLVPDADVALVLLALAFFFMAIGLSSVMTPISLFAPAGVRGRALGAASLCYTGFGGLGPLLVGAINDFGFGAPARVGDSMAVCFAAAIVVGLLLFPGTIRRVDRIEGSGRSLAVADQDGEEDRGTRERKR